MPASTRPTRNSLVALQRAEKAMQLRIEGQSWSEIAEACGWSDRSAAYNAVKRLMSNRSQELAETTDQLRQLEMDRLDALWRAGWELLKKDSVTVSHGKIIWFEDPETGERIPLKDDAQTLAAIDRLVKISDSRRKLLGLDAPQRTEVSGTVRYEIVGVDPADLGAPAAPIDVSEARLGSMPELPEAVSE